MRVRDCERPVVELVDWKGGVAQRFLEARQHRPRVGTEGVVAENNGPIRGQRQCRAIMPTPVSGGGHGGRLNKIHAAFISGQDRHHAQPQKALDHTRVVPQHEDEEAIGKQLRELCCDEEVPRGRVTERGSPGV
jgi:hypothetical protein